MNPQPYQTPPRHWPSKLSPSFVRKYSRWRRKELADQGIREIDSAGAEGVRAAIARGEGVLLISNHSYHYDSYVLIEAAQQSKWCAHFMTAWQVFSLYSRVGQWMLQKHGCFSINRESNDTQALRTAQSILHHGPHPLVIFPEGDIYHSNDRVMPFREGAAAIALSARKKSPRPLTIVPVAMKCFYTVDPSAELSRMMDKLEAHIRWRPAPELPLIDRIYRFGNGFLSLKEVEYLGQPVSGSMRERLLGLADHILCRIQEERGLPRKGQILADRIRNLRTHLIKQIEAILKADPDKRTSEDRQRLARLRHDMEDLFFVTQLSSYHGDYSSERPTIERIAETIDKFEEDIFALQAPTPRGARKAVVRFGEPIPLSEMTAKTAELTVQLEQTVQQLLNNINDQTTIHTPV